MESESDSNILISHISTNVDCDLSDSIKSILTAIESMSKPSLIDLANSHGVQLNLKMSSEELKNVLSDHLCKSCCIFLTSEGCMLLTSTLSQEINEEYTDGFDVNILLIALLSYL